MCTGWTSNMDIWSIIHSVGEILGMWSTKGCCPAGRCGVMGWRTTSPSPSWFAADGCHTASCAVGRRAEGRDTRGGDETEGLVRKDRWGVKRRICFISISYLFESTFPYQAYILPLAAGLQYGIGAERCRLGHTSLVMAVCTRLQLSCQCWLIVSGRIVQITLVISEWCVQCVSFPYSYWNPQNMVKYVLWIIWRFVQLGFPTLIGKVTSQNN
jgi:hypothetical protein